MTAKKILSVFLLLILIAPAILLAQAPSAGTSQSLPEVKTYDELRHAISRARVESRLRVEKAAEKERVREAWEIGRLIDAHVLQHKERADYGKEVLARLAKDLTMSRTELYYMLEFARTYPIVPSTGQLGWSHYCELLAVNDAEEREAIAGQAVKNKWSQKEIRQAVRKAKGMHKDTGGDRELLPSSKPGRPGTCGIILAKTGPYAGELALDLGFSNYIQLSKIVEDDSPFKEGEVVVFSDEQGEVRKAGAEGLYTYWAWAHRILDGDTIEAVVDLGFGITTTQILRLRGIDAPEIETVDGMEAKKALEKMLKMTDGRFHARVLIKTVKSDKYDRYLADVFYTDKDGKEVYLNNEILENGYAVKVGS